MSTAKALLAAFIATIVLSVLMMLMPAMGILPMMDMPRLIAGIAGVPDSPSLAWILHFVVGTVGYGLAIKIAAGALPGKSLVKLGMGIAVLGWLILMLVLMPMAGAGLFAMNLGAMAPIMTLILHLVFGAVLGWTYARLRGAPGRTVPAH